MPKIEPPIGKRYVITVFGAVADGHTLNTKAIQSATRTFPAAISKWRKASQSCSGALGRKMTDNRDRSTAA